MTWEANEGAAEPLLFLHRELIRQRMHSVVVCGQAWVALAMAQWTLKIACCVLVTASRPRAGWWVLMALCQLFPDAGSSPGVCTQYRPFSGKPSPALAVSGESVSAWTTSLQ